MRVFWIAAMLLLLGGEAQATDVVARVSGIVGTAGEVRVSVCNSEEYRTRVCRLNARAAARTGAVEVHVQDVPPGRYAVIAHHDRTGDGVVHTDWLGIPTDGVGVSGDAGGRFGPPDFDGVALDILGKSVSVDIALRQEPGG